MQIKISTRHGSVSKATQAEITAKVEKLTRFFERLSAIEITIDLERRDAPSVDLRVSAEHKHDFVATCQSGTLLGSVDTVVHKLEQQLRKYKERVQGRHRNSAGRQQGIVSPLGPEEDETRLG